MANTRRMKASELALDSPKVRQRFNAQRSIEQLDQNDQIIALLTQQVALLQWIADTMHTERQGRLS